MSAMEFIGIDKRDNWYSKGIDVEKKNEAI